MAIVNTKPSQWNMNGALVLPQHRRLWDDLWLCVPFWEGPGSVDGVWEHVRGFTVDPHEAGSSATQWTDGITVNGPGWETPILSGQHKWFESNQHINDISPNCSIGCIIAPFGATNRNMIQFYFAQRLLKINNYSGVIEFSQFWGTSLSATESSLPNGGLGTTALVCTHNNGVDTNIYIDGASIGNSTLTWSTPTVNPSLLNIGGGGYDVANTHYFGTQLLTCFWNRCLSPEEVALFSSNPFGMITPYWVGPIGEA